MSYEAEYDERLEELEQGLRKAIEKLENVRKKRKKDM
jgi:hypothetical protein